MKFLIEHSNRIDTDMEMRHANALCYFYQTKENMV